MPDARAIVLLGVSGSGKSKLGRALSETLGAPFFDGDDFHPDSNRAKMSQGIPLTDDDRWPWLGAIAHRIKDELQAGRVAIFACSGLKRAYRDVLRIDPRVRMYLLDCSRDELVRRLTSRRGHFFPASLLDTQLATLERPSPEEGVRVLNGDLPVEQLVSLIVAGLGPSR